MPLTHPGSPGVWRARVPGAQPHLLQSLLFFPPQLEVPLHHFPDMLGLFIRELGEVQLLPHLGSSSGSHLGNHRITASAQKPAMLADSLSTRQHPESGLPGGLSISGLNRQLNDPV